MTARPIRLLQRESPASSEHLRTGMKMAYFSSSMFGLLIFSLYGALLTSTLTMAPQAPEIRTFEDAYKQGYQLMFWKNTGFIAMFKYRT